MKKFLASRRCLIKHIPLVFVILALNAELVGADASGVNSVRQQELEYLLRQDCGSCHGMRLTGGLGPSLLPDALAGKPDIYLKQVISKGMPGTAMPPWGSLLSEPDIDYLVQLLTHQNELASEVK